MVTYEEGHDWECFKSKGGTLLYLAPELLPKHDDEAICSPCTADTEMDFGSASILKSQCRDLAKTGRSFKFILNELESKVALSLSLA